MFVGAQAQKCCGKQLKVSCHYSLFHLWSCRHIYGCLAKFHGQNAMILIETTQMCGSFLKIVWKIQIVELYCPFSLSQSWNKRSSLVSYIYPYISIKKSTFYLFIIIIFYLLMSPTVYISQFCFCFCFFLSEFCVCMRSGQETRNLRRGEKNCQTVPLEEKSHICKV